MMNMVSYIVHRVYRVTWLRERDTLGPVVRLNPDEIHIRDPAWFDILYAPNPTKRNKYPPSAEMAGLALGSMYRTTFHKD